MNKQHPLTDELIDGLACCTQAFTQPLTDEKYDAIAESMRAAADWQLKQVVEWMKDGGYATDLLLDLKAAMRPQQQENN